MARSLRGMNPATGRREIDVLDVREDTVLIDHGGREGMCSALDAEDSETIVHIVFFWLGFLRLLIKLCGGGKTTPKTVVLCNKKRTMNSIEQGATRS